MNTHLEGPWKVTMIRDEYGSTSYEILTHTHTLVAVHPPGYYDEGDYPDTDPDGYYLPDDRIDCMPHRVGTAHLIAAAPELLIALQSINEHGEWNGKGWSIPIEVWRAANAAIIKATGGNE